MSMSASLSNPPLGALLTAAYLTKTDAVTVQWKNETSLQVTAAVNLDSNTCISRYLAAKCPKWSKQTALELTEIDHWLSFSIGPLASSQDISISLKYLENELSTSTYLVGNTLTIADLNVFGSLALHSSWIKLFDAGECPRNTLRWFNHIANLPEVAKCLKSLPQEVQMKLFGQKEVGKKIGQKDEGKFVELPGAEVGKVVVRFPPEASGYLHIGHAKAALLNWYYREQFKGTLIMRFDDTNPDKEKVAFEKVILEDLTLLEIYPDKFTHTSDHFPLLLSYCEKMIKEGKAYVDDTPAEQMKQEREARQPSACRSNSLSKNLELWEEMKKGSKNGMQCCVRAKIDMASDNGCMRDPTIYRCKNEPHPRTGNLYKTYPTYDFACPIVDSVEGVTHTLRTMEYHDRDDQYYWFIDALGLRKPIIWEYSRLNMMNTVLSKRKLTYFVENSLVDSWEDPRFPTVRGVLRRGMTVQGLKQFIIAQGSSRSVVQMEWDKIWAFNKKVIDPVAPRYTALEEGQTVLVNVKDARAEQITVPKHPKNTDVGTKTIWVGSKVFIEQSDAKLLKEGENATFINWGNLRINKISRNGLGDVTSVDAQLNLTDTDFKKTLKLTWLAEQPKKLTQIEALYFDHIISKPVLGKDDDFKSFINHNSKKIVRYLGDPDLSCLHVNDIVQLQRIGFFRVDRAASNNSPLVLIYIPDGSSKTPMNFESVKKEILSPQQVEEIADLWRADRQKTLKVDKMGDTGLHEQIVEQGNKVRQLKAGKAAKSEIDNAVKILLDLKKSYKEQTGEEWKPPVEQKVNGVSSQSDLLRQIAELGDKVRQLKVDKAAKEVVDGEVKVLLRLKSEFKALTGREWKPSDSPLKRDSSTLNDAIAQQGYKVRTLKSEKAAKEVIDAEVKVLLELKAKFKAEFGIDWQPNALSPEKKETQQSKKLKLDDAGSHAEKQKTTSIFDTPPLPRESTNQAIVEQGNKIRKLKSEKAAKEIIDAEVKTLLDLKAKFRQEFGTDWHPNISIQNKKETEQLVNANSKCTPALSESPLSNSTEESLNLAVTEQGNKIRQLKSAKAAKEVIDTEVKKLLSLKADYKAATGKEWQPTSAQPVRKEKTLVKKEAPPVPKPNKKDTAADEEKGLKKQTRLGLEAKKEENLPEWYSQVITKGELIEYYDVSGCYVLRPWAFAVWEVIQNFFDKEIKSLGVQNAYFPMFVSRNVLEREKAHIADFAPEVAWVTKSGDSELAEHIAIRPTSETVMYPAYAKWIQSHRDLPLKLNQWNNVVRWEFKHPQPFLRTREFLWQEGHTAFATKKEAEEEVYQILELYARIYTELLAVPVVKGRKTEKEKFAGGDYTTTVEAFVPASGRGIQGGTSHHLGQNFSKMFDITFEDPETKEKEYVYQNSWGLTTRTIGVMIMVHADNQGLVLPPRVAQIQVVIVPCGITASLPEASKKLLSTACKKLEEDLKSSSVRVKLDERDNYSPGWKFNHWELKGVPVRVEFGPKDLEKNQFVAVRRDTGEKLTFSLSNASVELVNLLNTVQNSLLERADAELKSHMKLVKKWTDFVLQLDAKNILLAPFCERISCEDNIKKDSARDEDLEPGAPAMGAKSLCIPLEQPAVLGPQDRCIHPQCNEKPVRFTLFGRSY